MPASTGSKASAAPARKRPAAAVGPAAVPAAEAAGAEEPAHLRTYGLVLRAVDDRGLGWGETWMSDLSDRDPLLFAVFILPLYDVLVLVLTCSRSQLVV